jgi:phosphatidylserine/phosphatidylglycerophosphate/cardiolipin synthase-like enzyme
MNFTKIITLILIGVVIFLVATSYFSTDKLGLDGLADKTVDKLDNTYESVTDGNFVNGTLNSYDSIKSRVLYGSSDRNISSQVYFCPEDNCLDELITLIDSSKKTIDCAVYDLSLQTVTDSLILKSQEGLKVRFVSDYGRLQAKESMIGVLKDSNVSVITNDSESSYMHNKFCVFDEKIVWVGSMNFTLNGNYKNNNNVIVFQDKELAKDYTKKIDSFFNGIFSPELINSIDIKTFGNVESYFCPEDNCLYHLLDIIDDANYSLECMYFSFTLNEFFDIIKNKKIDQKYILEKRNINTYSQYNNFINNNIPVILDKNPNSMHNKFCVIDNSIIITGSMNLSNNGVSNNDESLVIVYDKDVANKYSTYFNKYWNLWYLN